MNILLVTFGVLFWIVYAIWTIGNFRKPNIPNPTWKDLSRSDYARILVMAFVALPTFISSLNLAVLL
jgi:hypothetical protein